MNNSWNSFIYKLFSPVYDFFFNNGPFLAARKRLFKDYDFRPGEKVLLVGAGTGADLERLPWEMLSITAIDYSDDMLKKARKKYGESSIQFLKMDAEYLEFPAESFDHVIGSLILSVVPDGRKAFSEMVRVCRKDGTVLVFDKFAHPDKGLSLAKKLVRPLIRLLGTDIGVSFERIFTPNAAGLTLVSDEGILFGDMYRKIVMKKRG